MQEDADDGDDTLPLEKLAIQSLTADAAAAADDDDADRGHAEDHDHHRDNYVITESPESQDDDGKLHFTRTSISVARCKQTIRCMHQLSVCKKFRFVLTRHLQVDEFSLRLRRMNGS